MNLLNKCIICGSEDNRVIFRTNDPDHISKEAFDITECDNCGLVWTRPQPSEQEMQQFYPVNYYADYCGKKRFFLNSLYLCLMKFFLAIRVAKIERFKSKGRILDLGCGDGNFLRALSKGKWYAWGIEFSESAIRDLQERKADFSFIAEDFLSHNFKEKFDVITMWGVFEHLSEPVMTLNKIKSILKDDGLLFISIPNINSLEARMFGSKWFHLDPPRHLFHYSTKPLEKILNDNGLCLVGEDNFYLEWSFFGTFQSFFNKVNFEFNFLYNLIKKCKINNSISRYKLLYTLGLTIILSPVFFVLSCLLLAVEVMLRNGPIINLYIKNRRAA